MASVRNSGVSARRELTVYLAFWYGSDKTGTGKILLMLAPSRPCERANFIQSPYVSSVQRKRGRSVPLRFLQSR